MKELTTNQRAWLRSIGEMSHGGRFYFGCGHTWSTRSITRQLCEGLTKKGVLKVTTLRNPSPMGHSFDDRVWEITAEGHAVLAGKPVVEVPRPSPRRRWDVRQGGLESQPHIDKFLDEVLEVCRKHGLSITHDGDHFSVVRGSAKLNNELERAHWDATA